MSTSCMQAIKQQLEAMPLEEFEDLLKAVNKGHEGMPQHAELLSQLKHHVKVQPDEPIQTKASDKDCRTFWKSLNQRENKSHRLSNSSSSGSSSSGCSNLNGNVSVSGNHNSQYNHHSKHSSSSLFGSSTSGSRSFPTGDQNANPVSASSEPPPSTTYYHQPVNSLIQGKYHDYNNHHHIHHHSTLAYGNSDADPGGGLSRRSHHERDSKNDNISSSNKNSYSTANDDQDDDDDEDEERPEIYTGTLPAQYILPNVTKSTGGSLGSSADVPIKFAPNRNQYQSLGTSSSLDGSSTSNTPCLTQSRLVDTPAPSTSSWDLQNNRQTAVQLNESYKSVSSVTSGASSYLGRSTSSSLEQTHGSVRAISPTLPVAYPNAIITKSPTVEGSQDKPPRRGGDRKKKSSKNVLRETVINPQDMPGYKGTEKDIDKLLEFVEGNQAKSKKNSKDKKKEVKPKGNEKQMLSKAASLDENTLEYGSKKSDESLSRSRNSKEVEKKNATNITKSSTALSVGAMTIHTKQQQSTESTNSREEIPTGKTKSISTPLVNGTAGPLATKNGNGGGNGAKPATPNVKPSVSTKSQQSVEKPPAPEDEVAPTAKTEPSPPPIQPVVSKPSKPVSVKKMEDDKTGKLDESDGPYVLVQSKKKKEKKKSQQREAEAFVRPTADQQRRDVARARRSTAERRKSVGSVPGSENSECSDDDDSVRSLPAGECTPRERIPKPCSSSGGTPQTSYADIARMSRDESGKPPSTPITILSSASASSKTPPSSTKSTSSSSSSTSGAPAVTSDSAFPALSPPSAEKTAPINNAVWPCRPRIESETSTKEKSTPGHTTKSPDLASKEEPSPLEASSLPLPAQSDISKCSSKLSTDKDSSTISKPVAEPLVSKPLDLQSNVKEVGGDEKSPQGPLRKAESTAVSTLEPLRSSENCVDGLQLNNKSRKTEEKKGKSNKVSEEGVNKTASIKGMENGDISSCHQEPVVFCGGKFDSSQLPAGQNIGFEFGFGVIEALNDNVVTVDLTPSPNANPTPVELPQLVLAQVENKTASERPTRSQEQVSNPKTTENCWDKALKTDKTSKFQSSHEKQTVMSSTKSKGASNLQGELTEARPSSSLEQKGSQPQPNMVASATNSTPAPVPSTECKEVKQQETLSSASPANLQTEAVTGVSTAVDGKAAEMLSQGKLDVAQLFVPSTAANIPESLYLSRDFMDTYAEGLANLSRQGKVTYHRVD